MKPVKRYHTTHSFFVKPDRFAGEPVHVDLHHARHATVRRESTTAFAHHGAASLRARRGSSDDARSEPKRRVSFDNVLEAERDRDRPSPSPRSILKLGGSAGSGKDSPDIFRTRKLSARRVSFEPILLKRLERSGRAPTPPSGRSQSMEDEEEDEEDELLPADPAEGIIAKSLKCPSTSPGSNRPSPRTGARVSFGDALPQAVMQTVKERQRKSGAHLCRQQSYDEVLDMGQKEEATDEVLTEVQGPPKIADIEQMPSSRSARLLYGEPPKPYSRPGSYRTSSRPGSTDRRKENFRKRSLHRSSTWKVIDFVLRPTTVECYNVSYYPPSRRSLWEKLSWCRSETTKPNTNRDLSTVEKGSSLGRSYRYNLSQPILKKITFKVEVGTMTAIMGASGSGKSTLLDVIAKRYQGHVDGAVLFNGSQRTLHDVKEKVGYVNQQDHLLPSLTVKETLLYLGRLSLPPANRNTDMTKRVNDIIKELGLKHVADAAVGDGETVRGLSGGERRRVSIGIQLLLAPSILLLDEPTTGLDSFNANQLINTLTKLTRQKHIVMLSIHQPRSDLFHLFHHVMLLNDGELVWGGPAHLMLTHFENIGHPCPIDANPLQFFINLSSISHHSAEERESTSQRVTQLKAAYQKCNYLQRLCEELGTRLPQNGTLRSISSRSEMDKVDPYERPPTTTKLRILTERALLNTVRTKSAVFARAFQLPVLAVLLVIFFTRVSNDQRSVQNRNGLMLETMVEISLATAVTAVTLCPPLRDLYDRESGEGIYSSNLFLISYFLHTIPFTITSSLLWTCVIYFGAGLHLEASRVFIYLATVFLLHLLGESLAILFLGVFANVVVADSVTTTVIMTGIVLASGVYRVSSSMPTWLDYIAFLSPFRYCGSILQVNELKSLTLTCASATSNITSCQWASGDDYLRDTVSPWQLNMGKTFGGILSFLAGIYMVTFIVFAVRRRVLH